MIRDYGSIKGLSLDDASKQLQDPPLSDQGIDMAHEYSEPLKIILTREGLLTEETVLGASELTRAQQTARILFGAEKELHIMPYLGEAGAVNENRRRDPRVQIAEIRKTLGNTDVTIDETRNVGPRRNTRSQRQGSSWVNFKGWLKNDQPKREGTMIIVGHGTYLTHVFEQIKVSMDPTYKLPRDFKFNNLDGFIVNITGDNYAARDIIKSNKDSNSLTDKCSARSTGDYKPFPLELYTDNPMVLAYKPLLDKAYMDILKESNLPKGLDPAYYVYFLQYNSEYVKTKIIDPIVRAFFIKIYYLQGKEEEWPPLDYPPAAPPLYTVPGYSFETEREFVVRMLSHMDTSSKAAFEYLTAPYTRPEGDISEPREYIRQRLLTRFPTIEEDFEKWVNPGGSKGSKLLDVTHPFHRFCGLLESNSRMTYDEFITFLQRRDTTYTEFHNSPQAFGLSHKIALRKLDNRYQQLYVIVPAAETNYERHIQFLDATDDNKPTFSQTRWIRFATPITGEPEFDAEINSYRNATIIQGARLRAHPDIAAAFRNGPPADAHPDVKRMFPEWFAPDGRQKYERRLIMLELLAKISLKDACDDILKTAATDSLSKSITQTLGSVIEGRWTGNKCPTYAELKAAFDNQRVVDDIKETNFPVIIGLQELAITKYITYQNAGPVFQSFKKWLANYIATKKIASEIFIPAIEEIGLSITDPAKSSSITFNYWRDDFIRKLEKILNLLTNTLPPLLTKKREEDTTIKRIKAEYPTEIAQNRELKAAFPAPAPETETLREKAVMNLPYNLDVVANLNEIDPKLAVQEVQNVNFQNKYVKNPNPPGIKISESLKPIKPAGWFSSAQYPSKQSIKSTLGAVRQAFGLPAEHAQDLTRIIKFAESKRSTQKMVFDKIKTHYPNDFPDIITTKSWGSTKYPSKDEMKRKLDAKRKELEAAANARIVPEQSAAKAPVVREQSVNFRPLIGSGSGVNLNTLYQAGNRQPAVGQNVGKTKELHNLILQIPARPKIHPLTNAVSRLVTNKNYFKGGYRQSKTAASTRKMKQRQQKGGGVTMPLGFYQDGAQMYGTYGSETGSGLGVMTANMARSALVQTGGRKKATRKQKQRGGFAPSAMGSFATNGLSLLPVASYMGYRMMNKGNKTRKSKTGRTGKKRQTRRH